MKKKFSRHIAITTIGTAALIGVLHAGFTVSPKGYQKKLAKMGVELSSDATYGGLNDEGYMKSFSLVDAGNYSWGMPEKSRELLEDTSKPTGIIINTGAKSYSEIYKELDYTKELVKEYKIEYPICLDIDNVFYSNSVSSSELNVLVNAYVKKANANGLEIYVIGDDYVMNTMVIENNNNKEEYVKYPIGLKLDYKADKINLDYDLIIGDKYIYCKKNYKEVSNLYSEDTFISDFKYTANEKDTFDSIGNIMDIPGKDLKRYNNITSDKLEENQELIIPNKYHEEYVLGVDISSYQGNIDFDKLASSGIEFAISRAGYTYDGETKEYMVDTYFNHNSVELEKRNIIQGAYYYTRATDFVEMNKEIDILIRTIEGHDISLPLYIDIEGDTLKRLENKENRELELELVRYYCSRISELGYTPGIYVNKEYVKYFEEFKGYVPIWSCGGYYYDTYQTLDNMYLTNVLDEDISIYQNTNKGDGKDLGVESDYICLDYADYNFVKTKKMN